MGLPPLNPPPQFAAPPPPPPRPAVAAEKKPRVWLWVVIGGGALFAFLVAVFLLIYLSAKNDHNAEVSGFSDKIAVVDIDGVIIEPRLVVRQLKKYGDDDSVKAIILHMDTPGGG